MTEAISVKAAAILIYFNSEFSSSELNFNSRDKFVQLLFLELNFLLALNSNEQSIFVRWAPKIELNSI